MFESFLVIAIVVVAVAVGGWSLKKTLKGEHGGCGCEGCPCRDCVEGDKDSSYPSSNHHA